MDIVGIVANPASGKDIRRLVARASVFDNQEKQAIVQRALAGMAGVIIIKLAALSIAGRVRIRSSARERAPGLMRARACIISRR